jgi:hypothetical protein
MISDQRCPACELGQRIKKAGDRRLSKITFALWTPPSQGPASPTSAQKPGGLVDIPFACAAAPALRKLNNYSSMFRPPVFADAEFPLGAKSNSESSSVI